MDERGGRVMQRWFARWGTVASFVGLIVACLLDKARLRVANLIGDVELGIMTVVYIASLFVVLRQQEMIAEHFAEVDAFFRDLREARARKRGEQG